DETYIRVAGKHQYTFFFLDPHGHQITAGGGAASRHRPDQRNSDRAEITGSTPGFQPEIRVMITLGGGGVVSTEKNKARLEKRARVRKKETRVTYLFFLAAFFLDGM